MNNLTTQMNLIPYRGLSPIYIGSLPSSPIGRMWVATSEIGLVLVDWSMARSDFSRQVEQRLLRKVIYDEVRSAEPVRQLGEYLCGNL
ncbi:MAG TPA: hypothetical protein VLD65_06840, partial [Anaerolineales bacterium]|nr:hypothetical protein [Anaerolineales bacterium]